MKTIKQLFLLCLFGMIGIEASAYSFVKDGIYYNITSSTSPYTVKVTYETTSYNTYSGTITIPSEVTYGDITYSVTSIGNNAFYDCTGLTSITIPNSVTSIGGSAFSGCTGLTSVTIPNSVTSIGEKAFSGCTNVKKLIYAEGTKTALRTYLTSITSVTMPNSVTSIGSSAFNGCKGITSITLPNSVTSIGSSAFSGCSINNIEIPKAVTSIGSYAFSGCCKNQTSLLLPGSVTSIGEKAFEGWENLESLYVFWNKPIQDVAASAFPDNSGYYLITLYVPTGTKKKYELVDVWKNFYDIQEWDAPASINDLMGGESQQQTTDGTIHTISGQQVTNPVKGQVYIIGGKKVLMK